MPKLRTAALAILGGALVAGTATLAAQQKVEPRAVPLQPLAQQARRLETALRFLGEPLGAGEAQALDDAVGMSDEAAAVEAVQRVLDRRVLATVHISPESRVRVEQGAAAPELVQDGTRLFLVKVLNDAGVTAPLAVESRNAGRVYVPSWVSNMSPEPKQVLTAADVRDRWANISIYTQPPMRPRLSGLGLEYAILQVYSRDAGQRSAKISFNVGQGTQDLGFRNDVDDPLHRVPARRITVRSA